MDKCLIDQISRLMGVQIAVLDDKPFSILPFNSRQIIYGEMQVLTLDEVQRLLIQAKEDGCYELFLLEIATGLRRGELLALQWNDFNFKTGTLKVERQVHRAKGELIISRPKTKAANRTIILPAPLLSVLKEYRKQVHSCWMFPSPRKDDLPLDPASVRKHLTTILERTGCRHIRFHDLRHLFATMSLEHGMDVKTLSTVIGHVSSSTTLNIYRISLTRSLSFSLSVGRYVVRPKMPN